MDQNEILRPSISIRSTDIRKALGVSPATFTDIIKKYAITYDETEGTAKRGGGKKIHGTEIRKILEGRGYAYPEKATIISFYICKGGVAKTTSAYYLGQRLSEYGANVLLIDADPQGNLTSSFNFDDYGKEIDEDTHILVDVYDKNVDIKEAIIKFTPNLHILPSNPINSTLDGSIRSKSKNIMSTFEKHLNKIEKEYDYIIFDCAPALNLTNAAISICSDMVVLPVNPDKYSMMGLEQTLEDINDNEEQCKIKIDKRILFTRFDQRERNSIKYLAELNDKYSDYMFDTTIRVAADVKNAITNKEHLFDYKKSTAKEDYDALALEILGIDAVTNKNIKLQ